MGTAEIIFISLLGLSVILILSFYNKEVVIPVDEETTLSQMDANVDYVNQVLILK